MIKIFQPYSFSEKGQKPNQEDALFPQEAAAAGRVFLVCDGMGGHARGEVASRCVADTIGRATSALPPCTLADMRTAFDNALAAAYNELDRLDSDDDVRKMGTTLTFLAFCTNGVLVAHIGDSRVYQFRPAEGVLFRTRDHSLVSELIASGEITEEEAHAHPQRNIITRAVQPHQECPAPATFDVCTDVRRGDVFFLCCDGVLEQLSDADLSERLLAAKPLKDRLESVRQACAERGTHDNFTAYAVEVEACDLKPLTQPAPQAQAQPKPAKPLLPVWAWLLLVSFLLLLAVGLFVMRPSPKRQPAKVQPQQTEQPQPQSPQEAEQSSDMTIDRRK